MSIPRGGGAQEPHEAETHYYRVEDPLENLRIRVTLRKLSGPRGSRHHHQRSYGGGGNKENVGGTENAEGEGGEGGTTVEDEEEARLASSGVTKVFKWQEKYLSPRELAVYSHVLDGTPRESLGPMFNQGYHPEYAARFKKIKNKTRDELLDEQLKSVMLFSYVDKDGYVPPGALSDNPLVTRTLDTPEITPLAESLVNLPRRSHPHGQGQSTLVSSMQSHLTRDGAAYKVMYLMAAVEVERKEYQARHRLLGGGLFGWGGDSDDSDNVQGVVCQEQVLATIKLYKTGMMEVKPGFSVEEPESGDEGGSYWTDYSVKKQQAEGARLKSYHFVTKSGSEYEYVVENITAINDTADIQGLIMEERARESLRHGRQGTSVMLTMKRDKDMLIPFMELRSATGFQEGGGIYVEYQAVASPGWLWRQKDPPTTSDRGQGSGADDDGGATGRSRASGVGGGDEQGEAPDGEGMDTDLDRYGVTQVAFPSSDGNYIWGITIIAITCVAMCLGLPYLTCVLIALLVLDSSTMSIRPVLGSMAMSSQCGGGGVPGHIVHFGFNMGLPSLVADMKDSSDEDGGGPYCSPARIYFQVSSLHSLDRHRLQGYCYLDMPQRAGSYDLVLPTWRPRPTVRTRLRDFFVGGGGYLRDLAYITEIKTQQESYSKWGFITETSGTLMIRLYMIRVKACDPHSLAMMANTTRSSFSQTNPMLMSSSSSGLLPPLSTLNLAPGSRSMTRAVDDILNTLRMKSGTSRLGSSLGASGGRNVGELIETIRQRRLSSSAEMSTSATTAAGTRGRGPTTTGIGEENVASNDTREDASLLETKK